MFVFSALTFLSVLLSHNCLKAASSDVCHRIIEVLIGFINSTFLFLQVDYCAVPSYRFLQKGKLLLSSVGGRSAP